MLNVTITCSKLSILMHTVDYCVQRVYYLCSVSGLSCQSSQRRKIFFFDFFLTENHLNVYIVMPGKLTDRYRMHAGENVWIMLTMQNVSMRKFIVKSSQKSGTIFDLHFILVSSALRYYFFSCRNVAYIVDIVGSSCTQCIDWMAFYPAHHDKNE